MPETLQEALERELSACPLHELREAALRIMAHYKSFSNSRSLFLNPASRLAYLAMRMPATYAAVVRVLHEISSRLDWQPLSLIDLGAGPGTGGWAAVESLGHLRSISFVEQSRPMVEIGQRLALASGSPVLQNAKWLCQSLQASLPSGDLALLSYCVAELPFAQTQDILYKLWSSEEVQVIAVIEPGTPAGYKRILDIREWALSKAAYLVAPCPHRYTCPMKSPDWCHFPARVERSRLHKLLKGGTLGYEDEKFSYIVFGKIPLSPPTGRIVGPPQKASGFVRLPLCTDGVLKKQIVSRKKGCFCNSDTTQAKREGLDDESSPRKQEEYRKARDAVWGDAWEK